MNAATRAFTLAFMALGALDLAACASDTSATPVALSPHAAAMPVFASDQAHPAVTRTVGQVKSDICVRPENAASIGVDALNHLRADADAGGATALVDYHYAYITNSPRVVTCQHYLEAKAVAVVLSQAG